MGDGLGGLVYGPGYGSWLSVTVVVVICCAAASTEIVSPVVVMGLPPWLLYMETEIWTESPAEVGGVVKPSCPLNSVPPFTDDKSVLAVPRLAFDVAS